MTLTPDQAMTRHRSLPLAFVVGALVGVLGGMIGLGGAEFRLPILIGLFAFVALQAVILNKAMSLIVVITAIPARLIGVPFGEVFPYWYVAVNLLIAVIPMSPRRPGRCADDRLPRTAVRHGLVALPVVAALQGSVQRRLVSGQPTCTWGRSARSG